MTPEDYFRLQKAFDETTAVTITLNNGRIVHLVIDRLVEHSSAIPHQMSGQVCGYYSTGRGRECIDFPDIKEVSDGSAYQMKEDS